MADLYIGTWNVPTASLGWYTQGFAAKLDALEAVVTATKLKIDEDHGEPYAGRWMLVAPEYSFMSFEGEERVKVGLADLASLKQRCEEITTGHDGLLLIPGSIVYVKRLFQTELHQDGIRKEASTVSSTTAYHKAIERLERFYEARGAQWADIVKLGKRVKNTPTARETQTERLKQLRHTAKVLQAFPLDDFNPDTVKQDSEKKRWLATKGALVRNVAYGFYQGQKRFGFKKRTNLELDEGMESGFLFDVGIGDAVYNWEGISVGLEICADAGTGLLQAHEQAVDIYVIIAESQDLGAVNPPPNRCRIFVDSSRAFDIAPTGGPWMRTNPTAVETTWGQLHVARVRDFED